MPRARGDDETLDAELGRQPSRELLSYGGTVAGANDGHHRHIGKIELALGVEERRVDVRQRRRVARLADGFAPKLSADASSASASSSVQRRMSWDRPPRRDSMGRASMAASAPPNSLMRVRKVAGPTSSLLISLSQLKR